MYVPFEKLPDHARLWIYLSSRPFTPEEEKKIGDILQKFCSQWAAHQVPLQSGFRIDHHQLIVIAADETGQKATGCAIDASVNCIRQIEEQLFGVILLDRSIVPFWIDGRVFTLPLGQLEDAFQRKILTPNSLYIQSSATQKGDYENHPTIPCKDTWLMRYLPESIPLT